VVSGGQGSSGAGAKSPRAEMPNLEDIFLFVGALMGVWAGWGVVGVAQCGHSFLETSTHAFSIFFSGTCTSPMASSCSTCCCCSGASRRCMERRRPNSRFGPFYVIFTVKISPPGAGFSPFWVGASVDLIVAPSRVSTGL
jgi:hypothetical protein